MLPEQRTNSSWSSPAQELKGKLHRASDLLDEGDKQGAIAILRGFGYAGSDPDKFISESLANILNDQVVDLREAQLAIERVRPLDGVIRYSGNLIARDRLLGLKLQGLLRTCEDTVPALVETGPIVSDKWAASSAVTFKEIAGEPHAVELSLTKINRACRLRDPWASGTLESVDKNMSLRLSMYSTARGAQVAEFVMAPCIEVSAWGREKIAARIPTCSLVGRKPDLSDRIEARIADSFLKSFPVLDGGWSDISRASFGIEPLIALDQRRRESTSALARSSGPGYTLLPLAFTSNTKAWRAAVANVRLGDMLREISAPGVIEELFEARHQKCVGRFRVVSRSPSPELE